MGIFKEIVNKYFRAGKSGVQTPTGPGEFTATTYIDSFIQHSNIQAALSAALKLSQDRDTRYKDFERMLNDPIISSALELITDDACQLDMGRNRTVWADDSCNYKDDINAFLTEMDIETSIWGWGHNLGLYGDFFLGVKSEAGAGVLQLDDSNYPGNVHRIEIDGDLAAFWTIPSENAPAGSDFRENLKRPWEVVHFINNYKPVFDRVRMQKKGTLDGKEKVEDIYITASYGNSVLANARTPGKVLEIQRMVLALARIANSPIVRAVYVNVEGLTPEERRKIVKDVKEKLKSKRAIDKSSDFFDSDYNPLSFNDIIVIPITGSRGDLKIEEFGGRVDIKDIVDIEYTRNELFGALRIPKSFLGFEESARYDTKVPLLDGTSAKIGEMAENEEKYVGKEILTCAADGEIIPSKILAVRKTKDAVEFNRVYLDNGEFVDFTEDHLFMMRDGSFKKVKDLVVGDSLMPYYEYKNKHGYVGVVDNKSGRRELLHRKLGSVGNELKLGDVVHHRDCNKSNNEIKNLEVVSKIKHAERHRNLVEKWQMRGRDRDVVKSRDYSYVRSKEYRDRMSSVLKGKKKPADFGEKVSRALKGKPSNNPFRCGDDNVARNADVRTKMRRSRSEFFRRGGKVWQVGADPEVLHSWSRRVLKARWDGKKTSVKHEFKCGYCGNMFSRNYTFRGWELCKDKIKFCGSLCQRRWVSRKNLDLINGRGVLNHKVVKIEKLDVVEPSYDLLVENETHTFPLSAGIFVHNSLPGAMGSTTLLRLDIRYARMVKKIQRALMVGLTRLCQIHLSFKYKKTVPSDDIKLGMVAVSDAEDAARLENVEKRISMVTNALSIVSQLEGKIDTAPLLDFLFKNIMGFTDKETARILKPPAEVPGEGNLAQEAEPVEEVPAAASGDVDMGPEEADAKRGEVGEVKAGMPPVAVGIDAGSEAEVSASTVEMPPVAAGLEAVQRSVGKILGEHEADALRRGFEQLRHDLRVIKGSDTYLDISNITGDKDAPAFNDGGSHNGIWEDVKGIDQDGM